MISRTLVWFCIVGALGFGVDVALLYISAPWLGWYGGRAFSFWGAATATWIFNRRLTFVPPRPPTAPPAPRRWTEYLHYLGSMLVGGALNYGVYAVAMAVLPRGAASGLLAVALGSVAGLFINFALARRVLAR